jgi:hypothetical protein
MVQLILGNGTAIWLGQSLIEKNAQLFGKVAKTVAKLSNTNISTSKQSLKIQNIYMNLKYLQQCFKTADLNKS